MTEPTGPGVLEPTTEVVPTTAVEVVEPASAANAPVGAKRRAGRLRWALAAAAAAFAIIVGALGFAVVASGASPSVVLAWAPSDAVVYTEVRADMPGDQRANLLAFLSKFPGFADQTNFDAKADEGLDRLVKHMTDNKHDFSTGIKPWFSGQLGVSVEASDPAAPAALIVASVRDTTAAAAWLKSVQPADATTEEFNGVTLTVVTPKEGATDAGATTRVAWGLDGSVILAGSIDSVKAAITRGPSGALAADPEFKKAQETLGGDALGSVYVDLKAYLKLLTSSEAKMLSRVGSGTGAAIPSMAALPAIDPALVPGWVAARVRAESDHLVVDVAEPTVAAAGSTAQHNRVGTLAASLPASTVVQVETHDFGAAIKSSLTRLEALPGGPTAAQVDNIAKYVGGVDKAVGWIGDTDLVALQEKAVFSAGVVAQTNDPTASADLVTALKSLVSLGGASAGLSLSSETYDGQTITLVKPSTADAPADFEIAFTQTDKLVIVGVGDAFVKSVLDTKPGSALADQPTYQRAMNLAGTSNTGQAFLDLSALRVGLEGLAAGSSELANYDSNIKPYLLPFESMAASSSVGSDVNNGRFVLVLK